MANPAEIAEQLYVTSPQRFETLRQLGLDDLARELEEAQAAWKAIEAAKVHDDSEPDDWARALGRYPDGWREVADRQSAAERRLSDVQTALRNVGLIGVPLSETPDHIAP